MNPGFLQQPGMDWVVPPGMGDMAMGGLSRDAGNKIAMSMARERLSRLQGDKVEAEIGRIRALTQADLTTRRLGHAGQVQELDHLRERYPLLISEIESRIENKDAESEALVGARQAATDQTDAQTQILKDEAALKLRYLEQRYPALLAQIEGETRNASNESEAAVAATNALGHARMVGAGAVAAGAADDARMAAEKLRQLRGRYPGLLDRDAAELAQIVGETEGDAAVSAARADALAAGAHRQRVGAGLDAAGAADDARMAAEKLRQLQGRYPGRMQMDEAEIARLEAAARAGDAQAHERLVRAGAIAAGAAQDAMTAGIERAGLPAQIGAELDSERALAEMRRARGQAALMGGPGLVGGTPTAPGLNPYSADANRWNDDVVAMVDGMTDPKLLGDVVGGDPMGAVGPAGQMLQQERRMQIITTAQSLGRIALSEGRPISPQQAVIKAVEMLQGGGAPAPAGGQADPLGIRGMQ